jgi:sporulation protein YlmC with PRC-barrel domain
LGRVLIAKVAPDIQRAVAGARMNGGSVSVGLARGGSVAVENGPGIWNGRRRGGFSPHQFHSRRKPMLAKYITAGLAASALLATVAFAQTPTTTADRATTASTALTVSSLQGTWRASKMIGLSVYNDNNESVGSINDILTDKNGSIKAVVIGVGGFLGVGEHLVAIPFEKIKFANEPVAYTGASNATGNRPASSTTTGSASSSTATASSSKYNVWYPDHAVLSATRDELKAMPEFKYST